MRFSDIVQIGKEYVMLGIVVVIAVAVIYFIGYFLIYRRVLKGTKRLKTWKLLLEALFVIYLVVVLGVTMLDRFGYMQGTINGLFSSYRNAWYHFDKTEWRNLILNICMFLPFGFLLPILFEKMRGFWRTYLTGFLFTVAIEGLQLALGRGIFECDDILNNLVGTMIGYGIAYLILSAFSLQRKTAWNGRGRKVFLFTTQIPLLCTVLFFGAVFFIYENKELGNLWVDNSMHFRNLTVSCDMELSESSGEADIYYLKRSDVEETLAFANDFFDNLGTTVDTSRTDPYQNTIIYWNTDGEYDLWIEYNGLAYRYTDFSQLESTPKTGASRDEMIEALKRFDIQIPESADFTEEGDGQYRFIVDMLNDGEKLIDGELDCWYTSDGKLESVNQNILSYEKYQSYPFISEKEAYEKIEAGEFYNFFNCSGKEIHLTSVNLLYEMDSKGFYRPVYTFSGRIGEEDGEIMISAIEM